VPVNLAAGIQGTELDPVYDNNLQEEVIGGLIEAAGVVPNAGSVRNVQQAAFRLFGGNITGLTANAVLTADEAGLVKVDATSANVTLTLPACNGTNNISLRYAFLRTDSSSNTVTIQTAGADKIYPGNVSSITLPAGQPLSLRGDGNSIWRGAGTYPAIGAGGAVTRDVTGSRAIGTNYVNTTGRPIIVAVSGYSSSASANLSVISGGVTFSVMGDGGVSIEFFAFAPVAAGATYSATCSAGTFTLTGWTEF
jgi:hypothetical protein